MAIAIDPGASGCANRLPKIDCDPELMNNPESSTAMPDEEFIRLRERFQQLPVDLDVRVAWADSLLLGSHHESVMPTRWSIERGDYDAWPALQAMQLLKNRIKPC